MQIMLLKMDEHCRYSRAEADRPVAAQETPHDRIVGHEYGVRPLLDDDELSDAESHKVNPFNKVTRSDANSNYGVGTPPLSPHTDDIFGSAPFRKDVKRKPKMTSPRVDSEDVFHRVPFKTSKVKAMSPQNTGGNIYVNQAIAGDVFAAAPFQRSGGSLQVSSAILISKSLIFSNFDGRYLA